MIEETFIIIKPNAVASGLVGEVLHRYETARFRLVAMKALEASRERMEGFYAEHKGQYYFERLVGFMTSGPIVVAVLSGENAIAGVRAINGATDPTKAAPGTIRHAFAPTMNANIVHSSDSPESAAREIAFWFGSEERITYELRPQLAQPWP
jgi:nucleoside-diphosphate kinase